MKKQSANDKIESIAWFHNLVRCLLFIPGQHVDPKWGRFPPHQGYNVGQVPLPFVVDFKQTYEKRGAKRVWVRQNSAGLEKRFCTLQVLFRPEGTQPPLTIIFWGKGKRISAIEKRSWDPRVNVMFQEKAWADWEFCNKWAQEFASPWLKQHHPQEETLMFMDNLHSQVKPSFKDIPKQANATIFSFLQRPQITPSQLMVV